jgi:hypothetical protein
VAGGVSIGVAVGLGVAVALGLGVTVAVALGVAVGVGMTVGNTFGVDSTVAAGDAVGFAVSVLGIAVALGTTVGAGVLAGTMIGAGMLKMVGAGVGVEVALGVGVGIEAGDDTLVVLPGPKSTRRSRCCPSAKETVRVLSGALAAVNRTLWLPGVSNVCIGERPISFPSTNACASDRSLVIAAVP